MSRGEDSRGVAFIVGKLADQVEQATDALDLMDSGNLVMVPPLKTTSMMKEHHRARRDAMYSLAHALEMDDELRDELYHREGGFR